MEETQPEMTRTKTMWYISRGDGRGSPEGGVRGSSTKDLLFHVCDLLPLQMLTAQRKEGAVGRALGIKRSDPAFFPSALV